MKLILVEEVFIVMNINHLFSFSMTIHDESQKWQNLWEIFWNTYYRTPLHRRDALLKYFTTEYMPEQYENNKAYAYFINFPLARV